MVIRIPMWTAHYHQLLYSAMIYSEKTDTGFKIIHDKSIRENSIIIEYNDCRIYLDYSDNTEFSAKPIDYDYYFKRSLKAEDQHTNVFPLNFQVDFSFRPGKLFLKMPKSIIFEKRSFPEVVKAIDFIAYTNDSHRGKRIEKFFSSNGTRESRDEKKVIFMTRLWDPETARYQKEKERRFAQNHFRINACRIVKKEFPNSIVGLYPDKLAMKMAQDLIVDLKATRKSNYLKLLNKCDIAIADDGLKDTPGWKIGEYVMTRKAIISTPIKILVEDFKENENYLSTQSRGNFEILPDLIWRLLKNDHYKNLQLENEKWYHKHMDPVAYMKNILQKAK